MMTTIIVTSDCGVNRRLSRFCLPSDKLRYNITADRCGQYSNRMVVIVTGWLWLANVHELAFCDSEFLGKDSFQYLLVIAYVRCSAYLRIVARYFFVETEQTFTKARQFMFSCCTTRLFQFFSRVSCSKARN